MTRLSDRLTRDLEEIARHATPSSRPAWDAIRTRIAEQADEPETEIIMLTNERQESGPAAHRGWLLAAAAAVALLVVIAGVLIANRSSDEGLVTNPSPTAAPEPTETSSEPGTPEVQDEAQAIATGERFVGAFANLDPDAAAEMLVDSPSIVSVETATDGASLREWIAHHDAVGTVFEPQRCTFTEPDQVRCEMTWRNAWFGADDVAPVEAAFLLAVSGDEIVGVRYTFDFETLDVPYSRFRAWLRDNYPADAEGLWVEPSGILEGPSLTEESRQIFEARTAEYVGTLAGE